MDDATDGNAADPSCQASGSGPKSLYRWEFACVPRERRRLAERRLSVRLIGPPTATLCGNSETRFPKLPIADGAARREKSGNGVQPNYQTPVPNGLVICGIELAGVGLKESPDRC
ncbi:MAG: hypothetical protein QGG71_08870 [Pirellulaceae bacterium]|jgi:hypothetical protein|nr:hypothetical protein [Planctomycetaceae bacterium]MDP6554765.1 hypothetical protein [Pirellulaceae bacterium]